MVLVSSGEFLYFGKGAPMFRSNYLPHPSSYSEIWQPVPVERYAHYRTRKVTHKTTVFLHKNFPNDIAGSVDKDLYNAR